MGDLPCRCIGGGVSASLRRKAVIGRGVGDIQGDGWLNLGSTDDTSLSAIHNSRQSIHRSQASISELAGGSAGHEHAFGGFGWHARLSRWTQTPLRNPEDADRRHGAMPMARLAGNPRPFVDICVATPTSPDLASTQPCKRLYSCNNSLPRQRMNATQSGQFRGRTENRRRNATETSPLCSGATGAADHATMHRCDTPM